MRLTEETDWLGGQLTAQGVSALDEHDLIERFGGTASYFGLRQAIRRHYEELGLDPALGGNPGSCWVTHLAFEPAAAVGAIGRLLAPYVESGRLQIHLRTKPVAVLAAGDRVEAVTVMHLDRAELLRIRPEFVVDATELGDLAKHIVLHSGLGGRAAGMGLPGDRRHVRHGPGCRECLRRSFLWQCPRQAEEREAGYQTEQQDCPRENWAELETPCAASPGIHSVVKATRFHLSQLPPWSVHHPE